MSKGVVVNPSFFTDYADQPYVPGFSLAEAHALAQAQAQAHIQAQAQAQAYAQAQAQAQYIRALDEAIYGSDEFRMYGYKVKRCTRTRPHDWLECPYAHRNEKAQRRDPRKYPYSAIACPNFRNGRCTCPKGDNCEYAHGIFEYWLHPGRYRTRVCTEGKICNRRVCFFAHKPDELRSPPEAMYKYSHRHGRMMPTRTMMMNGVDPQLMMMVNGGDQNQLLMMEYPAVDIEGSTSTMHAHSVESPSPEPPQMGGLSHLLQSLEKLKMNEDELKAKEMNMKMKMKMKITDESETNVWDENDEAELDSTHLDWISELVK